MLKNQEIKVFFESSDFDNMLVKVGKDDIISYKNNNKWLAKHPSKALIFYNPKETWDKIKTTYSTTFKDLLTGELPAEHNLIDTLKQVVERIKPIDWNILD